MSISGDNRKKTEKAADIIFFGLLLFGASAVTLYLFHRQTLGSEELFHSDMKAYILEMQGLNTKYSFPYPVLFRFGAMLHLFFPAEFSMALATMLLNSLGMVLMKGILDRRMLPELRESFAGHSVLKKYTFLPGMLLSFLAVSLFFVSMVYLPDNLYLPGVSFKYAGVFTANPFHNATYMAARPFAILAFFSFAGLLERYEKGFDPSGKEGPDLREYIFFSVSLLLATMTKPSFTIVLVGAAGLIMVWRLLRCKFRNFWPTAWLGLCFVPTFADLLYQYCGVFVPEEGMEGGIGFCLGEVWHQYCSFVPTGICLAMGFPLTVLILNFRKGKQDTVFRFSWQVYGMSLLMAYFLYEKGFRKYDFNFSWGYIYGIFFAFAGALLFLLGETGRFLSGEEPDGGRKKLLRGGLIVFQWLAFLAHLVCGVYYFMGLLRGQMYY